MLHVVSSKEKSVYGYNVTSGSFLYGRKFYSGQPYAITVYDADTVRTYKGMSFFTFSLDKKPLVMFTKVLLKLQSWFTEISICLYLYKIFHTKKLLKRRRVKAS